MREADAALASAPAAEAVTAPPLQGAQDEATPGNGGPSTTAVQPSVRAEGAAPRAEDPSDASAYAATALAPQPSVLEPMADADVVQLQGNQAVPVAANSTAHARQGIKGTVSRLKALFEKNRSDRQVVRDWDFLRPCYCLGS